MTALAFQTALMPRYMQRERVRGIVSIRVRPHLPGTRGLRTTACRISEVLRAV